MNKCLFLLSQCLCSCAESGALRAVQVTQLDRDTVLIALESKPRPSQEILQICQPSFKLIDNILYVNLDFNSTETVKVVNLQGLPSKELAAEMAFDFPIETLGKNNHLKNVFECIESDSMFLLTAE